MYINNWLQFVNSTNINEDQEHDFSIWLEANKYHDDSIDLNILYQQYIGTQDAFYTTSSDSN